MKLANVFKKVKKMLSEKISAIGVKKLMTFKLFA